MPGAALWLWDPVNTLWRKGVCDANGYLKIDPSGFLENPPTEDEDAMAPTSEWAYDHAVDEDAHHARYTDLEACDAWKERGTTITNGTYDNLDLDDYNLVYLDTSGGNILIRGIKPGYNGKIIRFFKISTSYWVSIYHNNASGVANGKIFTTDLATQSITTNYKCGFTLVYHGNYWCMMDKIFQRSNDLFDDTPNNGDLAKGPTANWAYDHENDASAHHARYTDAEAVASFGNRWVKFEDGDHKTDDMTDYSTVLLDSTDGDINLYSLSGGVNGKVVIFFKTTSANNVVVYHNSGVAGVDEVFLVKDAADVTLANYGVFWAVYWTGHWYVSI